MTSYMAQGGGSVGPYNAASVVSVSCDKGTMRALSRVLAKRTEILRESTKDAVTATAITCLVSVRSATREAQKVRKVDVERVDVFFGGFYREGKGQNGKLHRCLRAGTKWNSPRVLIGTMDAMSESEKIAPVRIPFEEVYYNCPPTTPRENQLVFRVTAEHVQSYGIYHYLVVCENAQKARDFEVERGRKRIDAYGGLARTAFGVAMAKMSTRNSTEDMKRIKAWHLAKENAKVTMSESASDYEITFGDVLNYAVDAVRGGRSGIDVACRKAANKIAGQINHTFHRFYDTSTDAIATPFPEIRRRRSA